MKTAILVALLFVSPLSLMAQDEPEVSIIDI